MYAVIESGGKQHRVEPGEVLRLEKVKAEAGETIDFDKVMMVGDGADIKIGVRRMSKVAKSLLRS